MYFTSLFQDFFLILLYFCVIYQSSNNFSSFLSEKIISQEVKIKQFSSTIKLDDTIKSIISFYEKEKKWLIDNYLNINSTEDICWNRVSGLEELFLLPQSISDGNGAFLKIRMSNDVFERFLKYFSKYSDCFVTKEIYCYKLIDSYENLKNLYATKGEIIIFYNDLILEIYQHASMIGKNY